MKSIPRWVRVSVLLAILLVGLYFLYKKQMGPGGPPEEAGTIPAELAQPVDTRDLTPQAVPDHLRSLRAEDAAVRRKAAKALWEIGPSARAATPALIEALKDPDPGVRATAAKALRTVSEGTPETVRTLVAALKDNEDEVRAEAAASLAQLWVVDRRPEPEHGERRREEERFEKIEGPKGSEFTRREREGERERGAREKDANISPPKLSPPAEAAARSAVPALVEALRDKNALVRANAASALAETFALAEPAVADLIRIVQKDPDDNARLQATIALGHIGPAAKAAAPLLAERLRTEKNYGVRTNTAAALGPIHSNPELAVPALVEAYLKDEADVRLWSLFSLQQFGATGASLARPALDKIAKDPQNQDLPGFPQRVAQFRKMLEGQLKKQPAQTGPGGK